MQCYGFPGGIGTSSRLVGDAGTVGVLLLCNFGERPYLDVLAAVEDEDAEARPAPHGSCIAVCATDLPLSIAQLQRLALRPLLGLVRTGSYGSEGSGEIGIAFATGGGIEGGAGVSDELVESCFAAAYESAREAVYNCLVAARPAPRLDGSMQPEFPVAAVTASARRQRLR
jgi:D-aminopeptidase